MSSMSGLVSTLSQQWKIKIGPWGVLFHLTQQKENKMSVKSWYLSVIDSATHKPVLNQMFFTAPIMNAYIKEHDLLDRYPKPQYYIIKENY